MSSQGFAVGTDLRMVLSNRKNHSNIHLISDTESLRRLHYRRGAETAGRDFPEAFQGLHSWLLCLAAAG